MPVVGAAHQACRDILALHPLEAQHASACANLSQQVGIPVAVKSRLAINPLHEQISIWDHDHSDAKVGNFIKLDKSLIHHKLDQFKNAFPEITYFWIALSSVVIAHFFSHERKSGEPTACRQGLALLSQKVQFDQSAIESVFHKPADVCDVAYSVRHLEVGKYGTFTLTVLAEEVVLMRIELGLLQKVARTADINILID